LVVSVGGRTAFFRRCFRALPEFVVGVRLTGAFVELVAFVEGVRARPLGSRIVGRVVFVFRATGFCEAVIFVVRVFRDFRAGQIFGGRLFDLIVVIAGIDEGPERFRCFSSF
jgi:hypothetical protein